jgi:hypothetical protein
MNVKRKGMTPKNEKMNATFFGLSEDVQMKGLGLTTDVIHTSRFKNMPMSEIIKQVWNGLFNSEKRQVLKKVQV